MSASTQPPPTVPMNEPSSKTTIFAPTCCGVEPLVLTTVAMAAARALSSKRLYISRKISADESCAPNSLRKSNGSAISLLPEIARLDLTHRRRTRASRHSLIVAGQPPASLRGRGVAQSAQAGVQALLGGLIAG